MEESYFSDLTALKESMKKYAKVALKKTYCTSSKESRKLYDIAFGYLLLFEIPHILPQIGRDT